MHLPTHRSGFIVRGSCRSGRYQPAAAAATTIPPPVSCIFLLLCGLWRAATPTRAAALCMVLFTTHYYRYHLPRLPFTTACCRRLCRYYRSSWFFSFTLLLPFPSVFGCATYLHTCRSHHHGAFIPALPPACTARTIKFYLVSPAILKEGLLRSALRLRCHAVACTLVYCQIHHGDTHCMDVAACRLPRLPVRLYTCRFLPQFCVDMIWNRLEPVCIGWFSTYTIFCCTCCCFNYACLPYALCRLPRIAAPGVLFFNFVPHYTCTPTRCAVSATFACAFSAAPPVGPVERWLYC